MLSNGQLHPKPHGAVGKRLLYHAWHTSNQFQVLGEGHVPLSDGDSEPVTDFSDEAEMPSFDCPHDHFVKTLEDSALPGHTHNQVRLTIVLILSWNKYVSGATGEPHWTGLFHYLMAHFAHVRWQSTVFVLVDNRDLTEPSTPQESLAHWPTVEAWWQSPLAMHGPARELCDLLFVPIDQTAGLQHVHPTWAGTFVLAALTFLFPGVHVVLLDSDCVPIILFEVADLWKEVSLLQNGLDKSSQTSQNEVTSGLSSDESALKAPKLAVDHWHHQEIGQGILLVTEHNAEINAGFIVAFASSHAPPVEEDRWRLISDAPQPLQSGTMLQQEAERLEQLYWAHVIEFLGTRRPVDDMNAQECAAWVQCGFAPAPFAGCVTKHTCDGAIAWSLIEGSLNSKLPTIWRVEKQMKSR